MHSLWNEVAPIAPLMVPLAEATGALTVIGLIAIVTALVAALVWVLNQTVGRLPLIGGAITVAAHAVESGVTNELAGWSAAAHRRLGAAMHSLARVGDWLGHEIEQHSRLLYLLASLAIGPRTVAELRALIHALTHRQHQTQTQVQTQQHVTTGHTKVITRLQREVVVVNKTTVALPGKIAKEWDIPKLRDQVKDLEDGAIHTWKWIRSHPLSLASSAFAGAVAVALQRIGASWVRCNNWKNIGKVGCGLEGDALAGLLGAFFTVEALANLRTLVKVAQDVEHGVAVGIKDLLDV